MPIIEIDEQTYRYLQSKAIAYVEKPGDTIRRLLGIDKKLQDAHAFCEEPGTYYRTGNNEEEADLVGDSGSYYSSYSNDQIVKESNPGYSYDQKITPYKKIIKPKKKRKTNLPELVEAGILNENQRLTFQNYRGVKFPEYKVVISDGLLKWNNSLYSMSDLARTILKELDNEYDNNAVRGPIFWVTQDGKSIAELWDSYLDQKRA